MDLGLKAETNFFKLAEKTYPGRGLVMGVSNLGKIILVYWIMGRSDDSRNRTFQMSGSRLFTEAVDPSKMTDPSLVIYNAMDVCGLQHVVSNGAHTDTIVQYMREKQVANFIRAMHEYEYEPDPNSTPRIAGAWSPSGYWREKPFQIGVIKRLLDGECSWQFYQYDSIPAGFGYGVHTYVDDGNPLPSWQGEPLPFPLVGSIEEIANNYWEALNEDNRVSLAVREVDPVSSEFDTHIINKF